MRKLVYFALLAVLLLAACSPAAPEQPAADQEKPLVTVYREPT
jgi:outer membrane biogenesis lipoprotein LolB